MTRIFNSLSDGTQFFRFLPTDGGANSWQAFYVPKGAVALEILAQGPGGNGGNGFGAAAGTARGGGGGGGSGAMSRLLIPARYLPEILYIRPGIPGGGTPSHVSTTPNSGNQFLILRGDHGSNGGNGTASAAGTAGTAGAVLSATTCPYVGLGQFVSIAGQGGAAGGVHTGAVGGSVTILAAGVPRTGGAGGAGCTTTEFAGGNITGAGLITTISGGALGANPGNPGVMIARPETTTGGSGAGSSNSVAGAAGGRGQLGSGGGGGGAGVTTGGTGGRGGDGFVDILVLYS